MIVSYTEYLSLLILILPLLIAIAAIVTIILYRIKVSIRKKKVKFQRIKSNPDSEKDQDILKNSSKEKQT